MVGARCIDRRIAPRKGRAVGATGGTLVFLLGGKRKAVVGAKSSSVIKAHADDRPIVEAEDGMPAIEGGAVTGRVDEAPVLGVGDLGPVDGKRLAFHRAARALVVVAAVAPEDERSRGNRDQRIARDRIAAG